MPLAIQPITPAVAALAADLGVALQPGAVVNAQVMRVLDANLVRIAIGRLMLDATTMKPLQQGQRLQLTVGQAADAITLTPVPRAGSAAPGNTLVALDDIPLAPRMATGEPTGSAAKSMSAPEQTLTPQETRAVASAAQAAVTKQAGLSQLFANLTLAADARQLPRPVAAAAKQLLGLRQTTETVSADDIRVGLKSSGLLLETATAQRGAEAPPDLKSALLVLKQALSTWLADGKPGLPLSPDAPSTGTAPLRQAVPAAIAEFKTRVTPNGSPQPGGAADAAEPDVPSARAVAATVDAVNVLVGSAKAAAAPETASKNLLAMQLIASVSDSATPPVDHAPHGVLPPPFRNGAPTPQPIAPANLAADAEPAEIAQQLLADTDGALARQTLLQVASLPDRLDQQTLRSEPAQPRWNFEIPFITPQGTAMAQFEIARDGGGTEYETAQRVWRARFSLNIEPAGPVHALITFGGEITNVKMWAERAATAAQIRANAAMLGASLNQADLHAGDIIVADGAPAQARAPAAGHFLNRAT